MKNILLIVFLFFGAARAQSTSYIASVVPSPNGQNIRTSSNITLAFAVDINPGTLTQSTVKVYGSLSGPHLLKSLVYTGITRSAVLDPAVDFSSGEVVTIVVTTGLQNILGDPMPSPYTSQFFTASKIGSGMLLENPEKRAGTGNQPWAAAAVDIDRNGAVDFLVLNRISKTVSVIRNYGGGNFVQTAASAVGLLPSSFAASDLNGDDTVDCAVANEGANTITVLFLDGMGTFSRSSTFAAGTNPSAVAAADVDGDGDIDLLVANRGAGSVSVFKNNGSGVFTLSSTAAVGGGPSALVTGDFNNDGFIDAAVANESSNSITVLVNNGSGTFTPAAPIAVGAGPVSLCAGDFDSDGSLDIAAAGKTSNSITVLRNDETGSFASAAVLTSLSAPVTISAGDLDGDGMCDIVGVGSGVAVFHNQGYFQFSSLAPVDAGTSPHGLLLVDFDADGDLDCVVPNSASSSLSFLSNRPSVAATLFPASLDFGVSRSGSTQQLTVSLHNDGVLVPLKLMSAVSSNQLCTVEPATGTVAPLDSMTLSVTFRAVDVKNYYDSITIVTNDPVRPSVKLYVKAVGGLVVVSTVPASNRTTNTWKQPVVVTFNGALDPASLRASTLKLFGDMSGLHAGEITIDYLLKKAAIAPASPFFPGEKVSAVCTDSITSTSASIRLTDGYGLKYSVMPLLGSEFYTLSGTYATGASPYAVAVGDFNRDGFPDAAVVNSGDNTISVFMNDTNGGLAAGVVYAVGTLPQALVVADVNEDGAPDIAVVNTLSSTVSVLLNMNAGDGSFNPAVRTFPAGGEPRALAAGDLDNDGHLDLVTANTKDNTVSVLVNDGAGHFTLTKTIAVGAAPRGVVIEDLNNDGLADLAVMNRTTSSVTVLMNARGTYTSTTYPSGTAPTAMIAADLNGDGLIDLATANSGTRDISVFMNYGTGGFSLPSSVPMYNVPIALYAGDMSGDGVPDIVVAQYSSSSENNTVQLLTNSGKGAFSRGDSIVVNSPVGVAGLDLNNRSILHLAVSSLMTNKITIINPANAQTPVLLLPLHDAGNLRQPISLQWQTTARTTAYHLQVADQATVTYVVNDTSVALQNYPLSGLAYLTAYKWRVRAKNDLGWGEFSPWWGFTTCLAPPPPPQLDLPAHARTEQETTPLFVWHAAATADAYRIQVAADTLFANVLFDTSVTDTTWQSAVLKIHTKYFWRAKASNYGGEGEWSASRSFVTLLPMPEPVSLSAPDDGAHLGSPSIRFSWRRTQWEVNRYWFEIATDSVFMFRIADSAVADTSYTMTKLLGGTNYWWRVRALNAKGWGPYSLLQRFSLSTLGVADDAQRPLQYALEQNYPNPFNPATQIRFSIAGTHNVRLLVFDLLGREVAELVNQSLPPGSYTYQWNAGAVPSGVYFYRLTAGSYTATKKLSLQK